MIIANGDSYRLTGQGQKLVQKGETAYDEKITDNERIAAMEALHSRAALAEVNAFSHTQADTRP